MDTLFTIDLKDYDPDWPRLSRPSARALIEQDGLWAMVYSQKYDYYKTPGGGIEHGESPEAALIREVREETGLTILPESIRAFGKVDRLQADSFGEAQIFEQQNLYYFAKVTKESSAQSLDAYEADEGFTLKWVDLRTMVDVNRTHDHADADPVMVEREARLASLLLDPQN